jgi:hypothetical protein
LNEIPLGRRRVRWEHNINMNPQEIGWEGGSDCIDVTQDMDRLLALVNAITKFRVI